MTDKSTTDFEALLTEVSSMEPEELLDIASYEQLESMIAGNDDAEQEFALASLEQLLVAGRTDQVVAAVDLYRLRYPLGAGSLKARLFAASVMTKLSQSGHTDLVEDVVGSVDLGFLDIGIASDAPAVVRHFVEFVSVLTDPDTQSFAAKVVDEVDLSVLEPPLRIDDQTTNQFAVEIIQNLLQEGYEDDVVNSVDINQLLSSDHPPAQLAAAFAVNDLFHGDVDETTVEKISFTRLQEPLQSDEDPVVSFAIKNLWKATEQGYGDQIIDSVEISALTPHLLSENVDIRSDTTSALGTLNEYGFGTEVVEGLDFSQIEAVLRSDDLERREDAMEALDALVDEGYARELSRRLDPMLIAKAGYEEFGPPFLPGVTTSVLSNLIKNGESNHIVEALDFQYLNELSGEISFPPFETAKLLDGLIDAGRHDLVVENFDFEMFNDLLATDIDDAPGQPEIAAVVLAKLVRDGYEEAVVATIDISLLEPLLLNEEFEQNAGYILKGLLSAGYDEPVTQAIDIDILRRKGIIADFDSP